ncbi:putative inactive serine/threonine-protein kinase LVSG-like, partial [Trifolium medium]|nr:putative inactive serine/threonine-protein kinase LVSG-like [Trifolium medium]
FSKPIVVQWEYAGESSRNGSENNIARRPAISQGFTSEYNPAKLLLNGVGWSIPQSQGSRGAKNLIQRRPFKVHQSPVVIQEGMSNQLNHEPWFWFPSPATIWDGPAFLGRVGIQKDDLPWKIRASVIHSVRAHHGAVRSLAVHQDESTVFTAGIGQGYKGTVLKWELSRTNCLSGYYGHEEVCFIFFFLKITLFNLTELLLGVHPCSIYIFPLGRAIQYWSSFNYGIGMLTAK